MTSVIDAQFGFLYQKYVYILSILTNISPNNFFLYEGKDDVDIFSNEELKHEIFVDTSENSKIFIQAKSGTIKKEELYQLIANWIDISDDNIFHNKFILYTKKSLKITDSIIDDFIAHIVKYNKEHDSNRSPKCRIYHKYFSDNNKIRSILEYIIKEVKIKQYSEKDLKRDICEIYKDKYCTDIKISKGLKDKRVFELIKEISNRIDEKIEDKKPFILDQKLWIEIIYQLKKNFSDDSFNVNVMQLKEEYKDEAMEIVKKRHSREVQQLMLVKNEEKFIIKHILNELCYKDFRNYYFSQDNITIPNIELEAKENYEEVLDEGYTTSNDIFFKTIKKSIHNDLLNKLPLHQKGCYIFLTNEDTSEDFKISWDGKNDE